MASEISLNKDKIPSTDSSDPNERKLARRLRIQARLEAAEREKAEAEGTYVAVEPEVPLINETIEDSEDTLCQLFLEGKELVTNVMVASDAKEVARRETVAEEKYNRLEQLREESGKALEKLNEISNKWETIMELNGPLELFENMKEQKAKCLDLIEQKNELIKSFQMELKVADEKFMKGRKAMYEELALLTRRIDEQVLLMKRAYRIELNHIEDSVDVTRKELIEKHQKTWVTLYNTREKDETTNMERKFHLVESFHEELHKLHVEHGEQYRAMRIHLENDIQILEQELEQVKALCLLNSEKLDYNYQVLKKREEENIYIKNHQKRRLNKLQDMVNILKKKIEEKRQTTDEEHKKLAKEVERYYKNILETESKAELFSEVNNEKFDNIWKMKDEEAKDLLNKILSVDMIIYEQVLGMDWVRPPNSNFTRMDMIFFKTAAAVIKDIKKRKIQGKCRQPGPIPESRKELRENDTNPEVLAGHKRLLSHIFELIADHSGFLMEEKLDELLRPYTEDEKTFVRLDNVFAAIGIQTENDLNIMKKVFMPYTICLSCDRRFSVASDEDQNESKHKGNIREDSILQMRELEEKVSKLRLQAKVEEEMTTPQSSKTSELLKRESKSPEVGSTSSPFSGKGSRNDNQRESGDFTITSQPQEKASKCNITHPLAIEKIYVLRALRDFVSVYHAHRIERLTEIEEKLVQKRVTLSRMISKEDVKSYFQKYNEAIPSRLEVLWNGVHGALTRYLEVLKERHELNLKAQALRRRNLDLKRLLSHYKVPVSCGQRKLPAILSVPNEPYDINELISITQKLFP